MRIRNFGGSLIQSKVKSFVGRTTDLVQRFDTVFDRTAQTFIDLPDIHFLDNDWWYSIDWVATNTAALMKIVGSDVWETHGLQIIQFNDGRLRYLYNKVDGTYSGVGYVAGDYNDGRWHRLVVSRKDGYIGLYVDTFDTPINGGTHTVGGDGFIVSRLGADDTSNMPFAGRMKNLRFNQSASYQDAPNVYTELPIDKKLTPASPTVESSDSAYNSTIYNISDNSSLLVTQNADGNWVDPDGTIIEVAYDDN